MTILVSAVATRGTMETTRRRTARIGGRNLRIAPPGKEYNLPGVHRQVVVDERVDCISKYFSDALMSIIHDPIRHIGGSPGGRPDRLIPSFENGVLQEKHLDTICSDRVELASDHIDVDFRSPRPT